ncbi:MAG: hypothetical protein AAB320_08340 [Elusimicrobiota bacterium]
MSRAFAPLLLVFALAACGQGEFRISGTITIASQLRPKVPEANGVLFVIAKNRGGVPVAVRRIVNPQFPVSFTMTAEDLLVPELKGAGALRLEVQMNTHGNVGAPVKGDLGGVHLDGVRPRERGVHIVIDRQL